MIALREDATGWNRQLYEWKSASVNVADVTADTNLRTIAGFTTLFDTVKRAQHITVEASGAAYIRLNDDGNDIITLGATTPFTSDFVVVESLFITTGGSAITITVKLS